MMTIKNPTSIKNTLERLETMMKEMNISLSELEDKIDDVESQLTANFEGAISDVRNCIGDDIQSAVSEINSNIDQLKD